MNQLKKITSIVFEKHLYHKIVFINMIRRRFFGDKSSSISAIVNKAVEEYFQNHESEITELIEKYHEEGGCGDL